jgi:hypothetical protein
MKQTERIRRLWTCVLLVGHTSNIMHRKLEAQHVELHDVTTARGDVLQNMMLSNAIQNTSLSSTIEPQTNNLGSSARRLEPHHSRGCGAFTHNPN